MVKAHGAPLGFVSMEAYPTTSCDWGMPFFSPLLKCAAYSDSDYCGAHKWLSEERGWRKKGWGQGSNERLPSGLPFCYQICWDTKRATVSFLRTSWGREKRVIGQHSLCQGSSSSAAHQSYSQSSLCSTSNCCATLCSCAEYCPCCGLKQFSTFPWRTLCQQPNFFGSRAVIEDVW